MKFRVWLSALAVSAGVTTFAVARADITGSVKLDGKAPEQKTIDMAAVPDCNKLHADPVQEQTIVADDKGDLKFVVVSIKPDEGQNLGGQPRKGEAFIDQQGCMYDPHVIAMQVGQKLMVKNSDPFLHNIHSLAETNPGFNMAQPNKDPGSPATQQPKVPEYIHIKCDVHPWMSGYVAVFDHPFFAVTGDDGSFTIPTAGLADGEYTLTAWQEKLGTQEQKVKVEGGKATANFTFKAEGADAGPIGPVKEVKLASAGGECKDGSCCDGKDNKVAAKPAAKPAEAQANAK
jgi:hypothetical protein